MKPPLNLLVVIGSLDIGGAEKHLLRTLPELQNRGYSISIWALTHKGSLSQYFQESGIKIFSAFGNKNVSKSPKIIRMLRMLITCAALFIFLKKTKQNIVHFFLPSAYLVGGIISLLAGQKLMIMSRRCMNDYQKKYPFITSIEYRLHKYMVAILCNSRKIEKQLLEEKIHEEKIGLIYNGITVRKGIENKEKVQMRGQNGIEETTLVLITIANYISYKGHSDLISALGLINESIHRKWILLCVGRDDGIQDDLVKQANHEGVLPNIRFLGVKTNTQDLLAVSDISLLCSHQEGFSNSILESMAEGVSVIATDVGGNSEAVVDGISGLIVPPKDPVSLGNAILKLVNDEKLRKRMGSAARERVTNLFSQNKCIDMYDKLYRKLHESDERNIKYILNQTATL